jgi:nucleoid-associated protein YgaU
MKKGDTLWSIAESQMGSGFEWKKLAEANEIKDQTQLKAGSQLIIPQREIESKNLDEMTASPLVTAEPSGTVPSQEPTTISPQPNLPAAQPSIQGNAYVVVAGDTLWDIAIRAYGDGYRWVDIARANNLSNPDLIFSGNKFVLPR